MTHTPDHRAATQNALDWTPFQNWLNQAASTPTQTSPSCPEAILAPLRNALGPRGQGHLGIAQINTTPGDLQGNAQKILRYLQAGEALGLDLMVFPELALMGYPPRDLLGRHPFLAHENLKWLHALARRTGQTYALVGFVEPRIPGDDQQRVGKAYYNTVAILGEGRLHALVRKCILPSYHEFEDERQFQPSPASGAHHPQTLSQADWGMRHAVPDGNPYMIHGHNYGISICEDLWNDPQVFENPLYLKNPIAELAATRPHALINVSASPSRAHKARIRQNLCAHIAQRTGIPLIYANQVGSVDEVSFDGQSRVYDARGQIVAQGAAFEEQLLVSNPFRPVGSASPAVDLPSGTEDGPPIISAHPPFDPADPTELERTYHCLIQGIRDYFGKTGFQRAVLGLSGGLDSSVAVVLLADALGPEQVLGISMPSRLTPEACRVEARQLADGLGIGLVEIPIDSAVHAVEHELTQVRPHIQALWGAGDPHSNARDNIQAISRATWLRQVGNAFSALPVATSDKSELYLGYATVNGDMSGALAILGDVTKSKVRALAHWMNQNRPAHVKTPRQVIPETIITKPSGADLKQDEHTGALVTAEQELMPYAFADEVIWRLEALQQSHAHMLDTPFVYEQHHPLAPEQKRLWLDKFFHRMSRAVFKWFIAPPILIVDGHGGIAKTDYHHPIVASRIRWAGHHPDEIQRVLDPIAPVQPAVLDSLPHL